MPSPFPGSAYGGRTDAVTLINVNCFDPTVSSLLDCSSDSSDILQFSRNDMAAVRCDGELLID